MNRSPARRPLASRNTIWAARLSGRLARAGASPNGISIFGMGLALVAGAAFWAAGGIGGAETAGAGRVLLLLLGAAATQGRLLCNLLDGMVAIEAGRKAPDGQFWNEFPDRISDALILVGLALGAGLPALGWAVAAAAFLTAYLRELGVNCGLPADFSGPMAKPHRMAAVTAAALLSVPAPLAGWRNEVIEAALWIILAGTIITALRRAIRLVRQLRQRGRH